MRYMIIAIQNKPTPPDAPLEFIAAGAPYESYAEAKRSAQRLANTSAGRYSYDVRELPETTYVPPEPKEYAVLWSHTTHLYTKSQAIKLESGLSQMGHSHDRPLIFKHIPKDDLL